MSDYSRKAKDTFFFCHNYKAGNSTLCIEGKVFQPKAMYHGLPRASD